jgi:hypothetical protein
MWKCADPELERHKCANVIHSHKMVANLIKIIQCISHLLLKYYTNILKIS